MNSESKEQSLILIKQSFLYTSIKEKFEEFKSVNCGIQPLPIHLLGKNKF